MGLLGGADGLAVALELADGDGLTGALELGAAVAEGPLDDGVVAGELALRDGAGAVVEAAGWTSCGGCTGRGLGVSRSVTAATTTAATVTAPPMAAPRTNVRR